MAFASLLGGETQIRTWGICHRECKITSQSERDIVIVASLLHDIGKVETLYESILRNCWTNDSPKKDITSNHIINLQNM